MNELTVMTWNVRYFSQRTGGLRATPRCMSEIADAICRLDPLPDVLALQEVEERSLRGGLDAVGQLDRFRGMLHHALHRADIERRFRSLYFPAHRYQVPLVPPLYTTGLALLVREDISVEEALSEEITTVRVPALAWLKQKRIAVHARLSWRGRRLELFNTHLSLPAFFEGSPHTVPQRMGYGSNQRSEIQSVLDMVAQRAAGRPALLVGDLNSQPGSPVYHAVLDAGMIDVYAGHEDLSTARFAHLRMHLDHIFASPSLAWSTCAVPDAPFSALSDHRPKVSTLRLPR